jgi:type IV pilus assembly protein PilX
MSTGTQTKVRPTGLRLAPSRTERGVVMFVALVVLIVMTLAGLAMLRQMSSGVSIAGNIAFKQGATAVADAGIEAGRAWLTAAGAATNLDVPAAGYFASWAGGPGDPDLTSDNWRTVWQGLPVALATNSGNARFIVQRLCAIQGPTTLPLQQCSDYVPETCSGEDKSGDPKKFVCPTRTFFRITARVEGPRNTVSYTQVVIK